MSKTIILLFGEMGCGKTHWGKKMADCYGYTFVEGDDHMPLEMRERVEKFQPLPRGMVDKLTERIAKVGLDMPDNLVISQALYQNCHREFLIAVWEQEGYTVIPTWIQADFGDNLRQLWRRPRGWRWVLYWLASKPFFQKPTHRHNVF